MTNNTSKSAEHHTPTIVIADDHEIYRRGLTLFLEHEGMEVIDYAASGRQAVITTIQHHPDILILDIAMPDLDGLIALTILKFLVPETRIIILTALPDSHYMSRAIDLGADGYFSKGVDNHQLADYVREITLNNGPSVSTIAIPNPASLIEFTKFFPKNTQRSSNGKTLTERETLILTLISMGYDNQKIGDHLAISINTIKTHMRKIYSKLKVTDRSQAVLWALRNGF